MSSGHVDYCDITPFRRKTYTATLGASLASKAYKAFSTTELGVEVIEGFIPIGIERVGIYKADGSDFSNNCVLSRMRGDRFLSGESTSTSQFLTIYNVGTAATSKNAYVIISYLFAPLSYVETIT